MSPPNARPSPLRCGRSRARAVVCTAHRDLGYVWPSRARRGGALLVAERAHGVDAARAQAGDEPRA
jgi:hypothetical protein